MAEKIAYSNFPHDWAGSYITYTDWNWSLGGDTSWIYVSASSFVVNVEYNQATTSMYGPRIAVLCWYYNFGSKSWTKVFEKEISYEYSAEASYANIKFIHNRGAEERSGTACLTDSGDSSKHSLFAFQYINKREYGSIALGTKKITVNYGGVGCMSEGEYNSYASGKKIISNGTVDNSSDGFVYFPGDNSDDAKAIAKFNPENTRGVKITKDNAHHCVPKWY